MRLRSCFLLGLVKALLLSFVACLATMLSASAAVREVTLAGIVIRYDDRTFVVDDDSAFAWPLAHDDNAEVSVVFRCAEARPCFGDPVLVARAGAASDDEMQAITDLYNSRPLWTAPDDPFAGPASLARDFGGLLVSGTVSHSGCRARTPLIIRADAVHDGVRYRFSTGLAIGCAGIEGFSLEEVEELLSGIALAPQTTP